MKQLQFYKYATVLLFLLNLSMITFFLMTRPRHLPPPGGQKGPPIEVMNLDEKQHANFQIYVEQHRNQMSKLDDQQRSLLQPYFNSLVDPNSTINTDNSIRQIAQLEQRKIESTYKHFQDVKSILRPEQEKDFRVFMHSALNMIFVEKKPPPPPRNN